MEVHVTPSTTVAVNPVFSTTLFDAWKDSIRLGMKQSALDLTDDLSEDQLQRLVDYLNDPSKPKPELPRHVIDFIGGDFLEWNGTCTDAAKKGLLIQLKYAHENGRPWDVSTTRAAAEYRHPDCLKYAHENGCE